MLLSPWWCGTACDLHVVVGMVSGVRGSISLLENPGCRHGLMSYNVRLSSLAQGILIFLLQLLRPSPSTIQTRPISTLGSRASGFWKVHEPLPCTIRLPGITWLRIWRGSTSSLKTQIALFQHPDRPPAATVTKQGLADLKVVYLKVRDMKRDVNNKKSVRYATLVLPER